MSQVAGYQAGDTATPRQILFDTAHPAIVVQGVLDSSASIDGGNTNRTNRIRAGWLLGQNSTTKKWTPLKRSAINGTAGSVQSFVVDNSYPFKVGDVITVGGDTGKTISAINYGTHTITVSDSAFTVADNDDVFAENGTQTARGILLSDEVWLVNEERTSAADQSVNILIHGMVDSDLILGDLTEALADGSSLILGRILRSSEYGF